MTTEHFAVLPQLCLAGWLAACLPGATPQSKSHRQRMVFLDFCRHVQRHFSSKFVKVRAPLHFFLLLLNGLQDGSAASA